MSTIFFYWDVKADKDQEYLNFVWNDYLPSMARLGISMQDGWLKIAGEGSQIWALGETDDHPSALNALQSREFQNVENRLLDYVENYSHRFARRSTRSRDR